MRKICIGFIPFLMMSMCRQTTTLPRRQFGVLEDGSSVTLYTLENENGMRAQMMTYGATLVSLLFILISLNCQKLFTPNGHIILHTFDVNIGDENGNRAKVYQLIARNLEPSIYGLYCKTENIPHVEINSSDDSLATVLEYEFDFIKFNYDFISFDIPDPGCYSELVRSVYNNGCRILTFRVLRSRTMKIVPMVVVPQSYLFQYSKG